LTSISGISTSPHWDNIICFHIENQPDLLLVAPDKGEIVNVFQKLSENNIHIRHNSSDRLVSQKKKKKKNFFSKFTKIILKSKKKKFLF